MSRLRRDLRIVIDAALAACHPPDLLISVSSRYPFQSDRQLTVVAAGKAAPSMAEAFVRQHGDRVRDLLVARGGHPVPDEASVASGQAALKLAEASAARGDLFVLLLSGGASAMVSAPADGISLGDTIAVTRLLLSGGLAIGDMNAVRKHLSAITGGQLGVVAERSVAFALSDVCAPVEDDPAVIGSGPTVGDPSTFADAARALRDAGLWDAAPRAVRDRLGAGVRGAIAETPKPGDPRLASAAFVLAGSRRDAMAGARAAAALLGYEVEWIEAPTIGEAAVAARAFVDRVRRRAAERGSGAASARPRCVIASGETTVALPRAGGGVGGRNQEFALAAALALGEARNHALAVGGTRDYALASVGTDGVDGPTAAAGAIADSTTLARASARGLDPAVALRAHDSHPFFRALDDLVVTGPTGTNVGDLQILLCRGQV